jgi:hypothetical protein
MSIKGILFILFENKPGESVGEFAVGNSFQSFNNHPLNVIFLIVTSI